MTTVFMLSQQGDGRVRHSGTGAHAPPSAVGGPQDALLRLCGALPGAVTDSLSSIACVDALPCVFEFRSVGQA
jgi:hypothetical protein